MSGHLHCSLLAFQFLWALFSLRSFLDVSPDHTHCSALSWVPRRPTSALCSFLNFHCSRFWSLSCCLSVQPPAGGHTAHNDPPIRVVFLGFDLFAFFLDVAPSVRGSDFLYSGTNVLAEPIDCSAHCLHTSHAMHCSFNPTRFAQSPHV